MYYGVDIYCITSCVLLSRYYTSYLFGRMVIFGQQFLAIWSKYSAVQFLFLLPSNFGRMDPAPCEYLFSKFRFVKSVFQKMLRQPWCISKVQLRDANANALSTNPKINSIGRCVEKTTWTCKFRRGEICVANFIPPGSQGDYFSPKKWFQPHT